MVVAMVAVTAVEMGEAMVAVEAAAARVEAAKVAAKVVVVTEVEAMAAAMATADRAAGMAEVVKAHRMLPSRWMFPFPHHQIHRQIDRRSRREIVNNRSGG